MCVLLRIVNAVIIFLLIIFLSFIPLCLDNISNDNSYKKGSIILEFKDGTDIINATKIINKYNCSIATIINKEPNNNQPLTIEIRVPVGKEKEYISLFKKEEFILDATLIYNG